MIDVLLDDAKLSGTPLEGPEGLLNRLTKAVLERALGEEMTDHLGYESGDRDGARSGNSRNGSGRKTVRNARSAWSSFVVHIDTVCVYFKNQSMASMVRSHFRQWLLHPWVPLLTDNIVWSARDTRGTLELGDRGVFDVPRTFVDQLMGVI